MSKYSEEEIIAGCIAGKEKFQKILYMDKYNLFYRVCIRYTKCYTDAEQLTNDGFIKIFNNIKSYSNKGSFEGWMRRIMVNTCLDHLKSKRVQQQKKTVGTDDYTENVYFTIHENAIDKIAYDDLLNMIHSLPETTQLVFNLFIMEGFSHREIAQKLGISEGTSQWHVNNARKILQAKIKAMNKEEN